jgi:hypothetical protein
MVWFRFVINDAPGNRVEDLEVEEFMSTGGYLLYRPVGSALKRIMEFELTRIKN